MLNMLKTKFYIGYITLQNQGTTQVVNMQLLSNRCYFNTLNMLKTKFQLIKVDVHWYYLLSYSEIPLSSLQLLDLAFLRLLSVNIEFTVFTASFFTFVVDLQQIGSTLTRLEGKDRKIKSSSFFEVEGWFILSCFVIKCSMSSKFNFLSKY